MGVCSDTARVVVLDPAAGRWSTIRAWLLRRLRSAAEREDPAWPLLGSGWMVWRCKQPTASARACQSHRPRGIPRGIVGCLPCRRRPVLVPCLFTPVCVRAGMDSARTCQTSNPRAASNERVPCLPAGSMPPRLFTSRSHPVALPHYANCSFGPWHVGLLQGNGLV